ncbi:MAG: transferrin-binding protein-like solute binding protein [Boseongicola sp. SB0677_bin_26]|nr:transferrin-binding protein-like solute binding protein [Boseongicola sp. SB0665_bin_10]MYG27940.1 transferrin-binding protein-like solute binding protein [Boseongicola sp. SB0677_bin_26]
MVGVDASAPAFGFRSVRGDAGLTIRDFAHPRLDVAFTNIEDVDAGWQLDDMRWDNVPMVRGGFRYGTDGNSVEGKFFGPDHEEAGGIFERDQVIGAFSAKRR